MFSYYKLPKVLLEDEKYSDLGLKEIFLYVILENRISYSEKNGLKDEKGTYVYFSNEELQKTLKVSRPTLTKMKQNLIKFGLLEEESSLYHAIKYYVKSIESLIEEENLNNDGKDYFESEEKIFPSSKKTFDDSGKKVTPIKNYITNFKDIKDNQDQILSNNENQSIDEDQLLTKSFNQTCNDNDLIENFIQQEDLEEKYSIKIINHLKKVSNGNFETFHLLYTKLVFAQRSVEKRQGKTLRYQLPYYSKRDQHLDVINRTLYKVEQHFKFGKVKSLSNYLFVSLKQAFEDILSSQEATFGLPPVMMENVI